jgi:hypothetical protein
MSDEREKLEIEDEQVADKVEDADFEGHQLQVEAADLGAADVGSADVGSADVGAADVGSADVG